MSAWLVFCCLRLQDQPLQLSSQTSVLHSTKFAMARLASFSTGAAATSLLTTGSGAEAASLLTTGSGADSTSRLTTGSGAVHPLQSSSQTSVRHSMNRLSIFTSSLFTFSSFDLKPGSVSPPSGLVRAPPKPKRVFHVSAVDLLRVPRARTLACASRHSCLAASFAPQAVVSWSQILLVIMSDPLSVALRAFA